MKKKQTFLIICIVLLSLIIIGSIVLRKLYNDNPDEPVDPGNNTQIVTTSDFQLIKEVNKLEDKNYLISPLSISYAFLMASEGALGDTKTQITNLFGDYKVKNISIPNRIGIANGMFLKDTYKDVINKDFTNTLTTKYNSDIITAPFKGPVLINNWVNDKTFGMIPNLLETISPDFVLGLANAVAIDVEWRNTFACESTRSDKFTKETGETVDAVMMSESLSDIAYIENDDVIGIVKDYYSYDKNGEKVFNSDDSAVSLEYIAIMPKGNLKEYINDFNKNKLDELYESKKYSTNSLKYHLYLPRYSYNYSFDQLVSVMGNLGVVDAFDPAKANFNGMEDSENLSLYINTAVHKTVIELNEAGTKAAAVTFLSFDKNTSVPDYKIKDVKFNKPFFYIIREKGSDNIWFFGTVYEPTLWTNETKTCLDE